MAKKKKPQATKCACGKSLVLEMDKFRGKCYRCAPELEKPRRRRSK